MKSCNHFFFEKDGLKVAFIGCSTGITESRLASEESFGCMPFDLPLIKIQVAELLKEVDIVVVQPHWGLCDYINPTPQQRQMAKEIVAMGNVVVIGHHSHVVQGVDSSNDSLIAYSLGNFIFSDYNYRGVEKKLSRENKQGLILMLEINQEEPIKYQAIHTTFVGKSLKIDRSGVRRNEFLRRCKLVSSFEYERIWRSTVRLRLLKRMIFWLNPMHWHLIGKDQIVGLRIMVNDLYLGISKKNRWS